MLQRLLAARQDLRDKQDGFTLIELLIVIVILGVLAGIVVFAVNGITDKGNLAACKADVQSVQVASEAYFAQNNKYAGAVQDLVDAGLLKTLPPASTQYTLTYTAATGTETGQMNGTGGAACQ
jgi:general secretion pathway protein G